MIFDTNILWDNFKKSFIATVNDYPIQILDQSWLSRGDRSKFYFKSLLPKIATLLDLKFKTERPFRIDGIFFREGSQSTEVPIVYIESENNAKSSHEEIYKLCCVSAPLKVLFICNDWTEKDKNKIVDGYWNYIIDDFAESNLLTGNFCILIAEWNEKLKFHSYCFNDKGLLFEEEILIEI